MAGATGTKPDHQLGASTRDWRLTGLVAAADRRLPIADRLLVRTRGRTWWAAGLKGTEGRTAASIPRMVLSYRSVRRPSRTARGVCAAVAAASLVVSPLPAFGAPETPSTSQDVVALMAAKARELEKITEEFNTARDQLERQQAAARIAADGAAEARTRLASAQQQVRGLARSAYADGMSDVQALLTSNSAEDFVQRVSTLSTIAHHQNAVLSEAAVAAETAVSTGAAARVMAADAQAIYDTVAAQQQQLQSQIDEYQAEFDQLSAQEKRASIEVAGGRVSRADRSDPASLGSVVASSQAARIAVDTALAQTGKPYVWGAEGPNSFDCSGLVLFAYQAADINLPHSSVLQATMGQPVTRAQLQPGDLVAFYSPVSHIGIYIGNGQMIHAPTSGDTVKITSIDAIGSITAMRRIAG
jgi:peptidoglycan DL-endopeptidase CwlO